MLVDVRVHRRAHRRVDRAHVGQPGPVQGELRPFARAGGAAAEEWDDGQIQTRYAVKVPRYINQFQSQGLALRNQPKPQLYFHRPIKDYLNIAFQNGFVLDGFEERAFPPEHPQFATLGWGGKFSEIPPALIARMRLK